MNKKRKLLCQQKQILDLLFLFTLPNASGYTLYHLENCFFVLHACFKMVTRKSVISPKNWNIKNTTLYTEGLKRGSKRNNLKIIKNPFYLGFPTGIYLFKINNTNRKTSCEICPKLTRKPLNQMCETEFLQMCSFSIILTSIYCLNLSFPLLFHVIPTAISKFPF